MNIKRGFTLIELLVVVLIIGILAGIALPVYTDAVEKSRASEAMIVLRAVRDAEKLYRLTHGTYADTFAKLDYAFFDKQGVTVSGGGMTSKHFVYALHDMTGSTPHAQALRSSESNWYIVSYMEAAVINCVTAVSNQKGNNFCKKFSSRVSTCPESGYNCYSIPD